MKSFRTLCSPCLPDTMQSRSLFSNFLPNTSRCLENIFPYSYIVFLSTWSRYSFDIFTHVCIKSVVLYHDFISVANIIISYGRSDRSPDRLPGNAKCALQYNSHPYSERTCCRHEYACSSDIQLSDSFPQTPSAYPGFSRH